MGGGLLAALRGNNKAGLKSAKERLAADLEGARAALAAVEAKAADAGAAVTMLADAYAGADAAVKQRKRVRGGGKMEREKGGRREGNIRPPPNILPTP